MNSLKHRLYWAGIPAANCAHYAPIATEYVCAGQSLHVATLMARALYHRDTERHGRLESDARAIGLSITAGM